MTSIKISEFDFSSQGPDEEPLTQRFFREAVNEVASKAKTTLPKAVNGRIDRAVQIVFDDDVELFQDGRAVVGSQSETTMHYVVNGECECPDSDRPEIEGWCKHRIAASILKRAEPLARAKLHAYIDAEQSAKQALPEAPASVNCYVTIAGRNVQLTLRDRDKDRLLRRLEALLGRFPVEDEPQDSAEPPDGWCPIHHVQMKRYSNRRGSWWSHKTDEGTWCKGK